MKYLKPLIAPSLGLLVALSLSAGLLSVLGETPMVLVEAIKNTLFSHFGLGYALFYATPLIFTGLSVALCFHCGLFNIGAEGQLYFGSIAVIAFASFFPELPGPFSILGGILAAMVGGAIWGYIPGLLKAKRGSHEVIVTILLNFIAISTVAYLILYKYKNPDIQNPESILVSDSYHLYKLSDITGFLGSELFKTTPVNLSLLLAIASAVFVYWLLFKTTIGYEMRAVGLNPTASRFNGISVSKNSILAFTIAGALSGMVGVNEVMGHEHKLIEGFSPGYGFSGIAVALLCRNHPIGIILSAFLFGALQNMARELEFLSDKVSREISLVLQATLIAFVAIRFINDWIQTYLKSREAKNA